jgi:hypothetical protein
VTQDALENLKQNLDAKDQELAMQKAIHEETENERQA